MIPLLDIRQSARVVFPVKTTTFIRISLFLNREGDVPHLESYLLTVRTGFTKISYLPTQSTARPNEH